MRKEALREALLQALLGAIEEFAKAHRQLDNVNTALEIASKRGTLTAALVEEGRCAKALFDFACALVVDRYDGLRTLDAESTPYVIPEVCS